MQRFVAKPLFWILLLALALRLWGITYGFPLFLVNDEMAHVYGALKMIELKTLLPVLHQEEFAKVLYYPPLPSYVLLLVLAPVIGLDWLFSGLPALSEYKLMLALDPSFIWVAARIFVALIGVIDVAAIYFLTRRVFQNERSALFAALFAAVSFYHLQLSHNVRHWLPAAFLLTTGWLLSVPIFEGKAGWKRYVSAGALLGAAAGGVNTAALIGIIPVFLASLFRQRNAGEPRIQIKELGLFFIFFAAVALLFVALYPYGFTRAEGAESPSADFFGRLTFLSEKSVSGLIAFWGLYARTLWNFETPLLMAGLLGIVLSFFSGKRFWALTAVAYALSFFSLLYFFDDYTARGIIFVIPILAVFAGYAADLVWQKLRNSEIEKLGKPRRQFLNFLISISFFLALFGWQSAVAFRYEWLLAQDDTRLVAVKWINENIPAGSKIVMDSQYMRLANTKEGILELRAIDPASLRAADLALLSLPDERYPKPAFHVLNLNFISPGTRKAFSADFFRENNFKYLIVEYSNKADISEDAVRLMPSAKLAQHFSQWRRPREQSFDGSGKIRRLSLFELTEMKRFGLFVDIYEL